MSSLNLVRLEALGALLASVAWTVLGLRFAGEHRKLSTASPAFECPFHAQ